MRYRGVIRATVIGLMAALTSACQNVRPNEPATIAVEQPQLGMAWVAAVGDVAINGAAMEYVVFPGTPPKVEHSETATTGALPRKRHPIIDTRTHFSTDTSHSDLSFCPVQEAPPRSRGSRH